MIDKLQLDDTPQAFVAMDFDPNLEPVYEKVIRATLEEYGFRCVRGDEIRRLGVVVDQVAEYIDKSDLIVCEVTPDNPNVFFELGIASALDKPALLLAKKNIEMPFNIQHSRFLLYEDDKFGFLKLRKDILETLAQEFPKEVPSEAPLEEAVQFAVTEEELAAALRVLTIETSSVDEKKHAVQMLGDQKRQDAYADIQNTARLHSDHDLRRESYTALYKIDPMLALDDLREYGLFDWWYLVREWAVMLLGNYPPTEGMIGDLMYKLADDSWGVQVAVCRVLGKWEAVEALGRLQHLVYSPVYPVRVAAEAALEKLEIAYRKNPHPVRKKEPESAAADNDDDEEDRVESQR